VDLDLDEKHRAFAAGRSRPAQGRAPANTDEAVARGVFGAPTCFVGEQMFFGQDRLDFVREALG
jgi:2-hydroxychromene-2-carboxylate isomerase